MMLLLKLFCLFINSSLCSSICRYVKRLVNWFKHKEETEADVYTRWEKDFDLVPIEQHGLFYEYLELGAWGLGWCEGDLSAYNRVLNNDCITSVTERKSFCVPLRNKHVCI